MWQKSHSLPIPVKGVKELSVTPGCFLLWMAFLQLTCKNYTFHYNPTIFRYYVLERAAEKPTYCLLQTTSFSSLRGKSPNQHVQELLWDLLLVSHVGTNSKGMQPKGSFIWCPYHLSWLLSRKTGSCQLDGPPKSSAPNSIILCETGHPVEILSCFSFW